MFINTEDEFLPFYLGSFSNRYFNLNCADIDGDELDEIILQLAYPAINGTFLSSWILKYDGKHINTLFLADGTNINEKPVNWIDPEFELAFMDDFRITVENKITGYREVFDAKKDFNFLKNGLVDILYDENGNVNISHPTYGIYFEKDKSYKNSNSTFEYDILYRNQARASGQASAVDGLQTEQEIRTGPHSLLCLSLIHI